MRKKRHGITFIAEFDKCCICNPWVKNGPNNEPYIDDKLVFYIKHSVLSIIYGNPGIDLHSLYKDYVIKFILTPYQLFKICQSLQNEMKINIIQSIKPINIFQPNDMDNNNNVSVSSSYRFFATVQ